MTKQKIFITIAVLAVLGAGAWFLINSQTPVEPAGNSAQTSTPPVVQAPGSVTTPSVGEITPVSGEKTFTLNEVAKHASAVSCYTVVKGNVYDLSSWIDQHPGGAGTILSMCGNDSTNAFIAQHGGQRKPEAELASFQIGVLAK